MVMMVFLDGAQYERMMMTHLPNETISQSSSVHISVDTSTQHKKSLQDIHEEEASMYIM